MKYLRDQWKVILCTILGNALLAFTICAFIVPQNFMLGGSGGIALTIQQFFPLRLSVLSAVINGSLFLLGLVFLGWQFSAKSLFSTVIYPVIMAVFEFLPVGELFADEDPLICALYSAVLIGTGIGLVVRVGGSTGGMDIPPCILQKYKGIPVGKSLMFFDAAVILMQVCFKGIDGILYSLLIIVLTSLVVDRTIISGEQKVGITIISPKIEEIRQTMLSHLDIGLSMLKMETGYEGVDQKAIYSVVYAKKYPEVRDAVLKIDPTAFIVAADVKNVNGVGYTLSRPEKKK